MENIVNPAVLAQIALNLRRRRIIAGILGVEIIRRRRLRRRKWVRDWIHRRLDGLGTLHLHHRELRVEEEDDYQNFCRLSPAVFEELLGRIENRIRRRDTVMRQAIPSRQRLSILLRFLATGDEFQNLQFSTRMARNTISGVVVDTMKAIIAELKDECIKCPNTPEDWKIVEEQFRVMWDFPHCVGAIDGKHVNFRPSRLSGSYYRNYKGSDSIVLLALVDARYRFLFIDVGRNGRMNDAAVFSESELGRALRDASLNFPEPSPLPRDATNKPMPYVITADDAFPLSTYMMKPYPHRGLSQSQRIYNYRLSRARRVVENAFGILSNRFRILLKTISLKVEKVEMIVMVCCILHNFILARQPVPVMAEGDDSAPKDPDCVLRGLCQQGGNNANNRAKAVRDYFKDYFSTIGIVEWQDERVAEGQF